MPETHLQEHDYTQAGPQVGQVFPNVRLPDQSGRPVDLHEARAGRRALVVFHRSAKW
jgi:peroxiredoxin